jgi:pimeloyl-ACP methyl ester carboxylesterase
MGNIKVIILIVISVITLVPLKSSFSQQKAGDLKIEPYLLETQDKQNIDAELGRLLVPENRNNPQSRRIELAFVRLKTTSNSPGAPIVYLEGGPGNSGINAARGAGLSLLLALREVGDVILLDQRGTGMSKPNLSCSRTWDLPLDKPGDQHELLRVVKEKAQACVQDLKKQGIDLSGYNTNESADDVEALRQALKVEKISLWGISYGTHLALATIRKYEKSIDRVILTGVSGPDNALLKLPSTVQEQLVKIDQLIKADQNLSKLIPDLPDLMKKLLDQLEKKPATVEVTDARTRQKVSVTVGEFDLEPIRKLEMRRSK